MRRLVIGFFGFVLVATGCGSPATVPTDSPPAGAGTTKSAAASTTVKIVAVGDISCKPNYGNPKASPPVPAGPFPPPETDIPAPGCRQAATQQLAQDLGPDQILTLGDNQYNSAKPEEFKDSFAYSWGRFGSLLKPTPGNHDYDRDKKDAVAASAGYFGYFGSAAGPPDKGYYSYDLGSWHLIALNTNDIDKATKTCKWVACDASSAQVEWLKADLAASKQPCTLAYFHQPLFSTSMRRGSPAAKPIWDALSAAGADLVLNSHEHHYERFAPQTVDGKPTGGTLIREIVAGTGGEYLDGTLPKDIAKGEVSFPEPPAANSEVRLTEFGVLAVDLQPDGYTWQFVNLDRQTDDQGSITKCNAKPA